MFSLNKTDSKSALSICSLCFKTVNCVPRWAIKYISDRPIVFVNAIINPRFFILFFWVSVCPPSFFFFFLLNVGPVGNNLSAGREWKRSSSVVSSRRWADTLHGPSSTAYTGDLLKVPFVMWLESKLLLDSNPQFPLQALYLTQLWV